MTAPSTTPRPQAPVPQITRIPQELKYRHQWVCWAYMLDKNGKWTKVPYTPGTTSKASHSRPASWRSLAEAVATYHARPDFFSGIGYVFAKDDPYVGGDIDHCIINGVLSDDAQQRLPSTYAEISPSGTGIKFIARATGDYAHHKKRGELYSKQRFFTITGDVLRGHETITDCQDAVDAFAASLGSTSGTSATKDAPGTGSRAALVKQIPESEWSAARALLLDRAESDKAMRRLDAAGRAAARRNRTQLAFLHRGDYAGHQRMFPRVQLYRADGSLDDSQVRAAWHRSSKAVASRSRNMLSRCHVNSRRNI